MDALLIHLCLVSGKEKIPADRISNPVYSFEAAFDGDVVMSSNEFNYSAAVR